MPSYADDGLTPAVTTDYLYAPIPEAVIYDTCLSPQAVRVYGVLMRHGLSPDNCFPSHERIGGFIGIAGRSVQRPLAELVSNGWITKVRRWNKHGERTSDGYHLHTVRAESRSTTALNDALGQRAETSEEGKQLSNEKPREPRSDGDTPPAPNGAAVAASERRKPAPGEAKAMADVGRAALRDARTRRVS